MTKTGKAHTLHAHDHHLGWDRAIPPVLRVAPGDRVVFETLEASGGQVTCDSTAADLGRLDPGRANPVTGPIAVDGAQPGDALVVRILHMAPGDFGWTGNIPGFGLLADQFPEPALALWTLDPARMQSASFRGGIDVPLKPMVGTVGLAPAEHGRHAVIPPRRVGGNMDLRDLGPGTELILPVEVTDALLSVGDTHAAQGDGEVCGTAIESAMTVELEVRLLKGEAPRFPVLRTPGPVTRHLDHAGYEVCTGIGPDLVQAARDAVSSQVERLAARHGLSPVDAYLLCSVCADLRISEIVDAPNWVASLYFPRAVLD